MNNGRSSGPVPPLLERLLAEQRERLLVEQRERWQRGDRVPVEVFLGPHPELRDDAEAVLHLVFNEVVLREQAGETPRLEEYQQRFPRLTTELGLQFALDRALQADLLAPTLGPTKMASAEGQPPGPAGQQSIPGYEIMAELGRGGMGIVYQAWQTNLSRMVALKMILSGAHAGPEELARFRGEAMAVARLQHPNIVPIYEVGEHDGRPYFALEYVEGGSLEQKLAGTPQPAREAAGLVETLARAVHYAHQRGIVHRDLKPANILLSYSGRSQSGASPSPLCGRTLNEAVPRITDFGLAKVLIGAPGNKTQSGAIMGTPSYMAPEQAQSKAREVGPATDVYALGAILYELLTGRPPFKGTSAMETLQQVVLDEPVAPSRLRPRTPRDLETICLKCLRKEPAGRYASAAELADDLGRFARDEPIRARPLGPAERLWRWCRHSPAVAGLAASVAALLLALAAGTSAAAVWLGRERDAARAAEGEARRQEGEARENFRQARAAVDEYLVRVSESDDLRAHGLEPLRRQLLGAAQEFYKEFVRRRGDDPGLAHDLGLAYLRLGLVAEELGEHAEAEASYARAVDLFRQVAEDDPAAVPARDGLARGRQGLAAVAAATGRKGRAEEEYARALADWQGLATDYPAAPEYQARAAECHNNLGGLYRSTGRKDQAGESYGHALAILEGLCRDHAEVPAYASRLADTHKGLALLHSDLGDWDGAEASYRQAVDVWERLAGLYPAAPEYRSRLADTRHLLGALYHTTGRSGLAEAECRKALDLMEQLARERPSVPKYQSILAENYHNVGVLHYQAGRLVEAEGAWRQALVVRERLARDYPTVSDYRSKLADTYQNLGGLYEGLGQWDKVEEVWRQALAERERLAHDNPAVTEFQSRLAEAHNNMGVLYAERDRSGKAEAAHRDALRIRQSLANEHSAVLEYQARLGDSHYNLGGLYGATGRLDEALASHLQSRAVREPLARANPAVTEYQKDLADSVYALAVTHAAASAAARADEKLPPADRERVGEEHARSAVGLLRWFREGGNAKTLPSGLKGLLTGKDLDVLRSREDFKDLLAEAEKGARGELPK